MKTRFEIADFRSEIDGKKTEVLARPRVSCKEVE
jgi:hypothetical protein